MNTHLFLLLCSLSVVVTAQDCGRPELEENMFLKGDAIHNETFQDGSSVKLGCIPGYAPSGPSSLTCRGGTWSTLRMTCTKKNCGNAGEVDHGHVEYPEGTKFGAVLQVTCNPGYRKVGGRRDMACGVQGVWLGRLPECEAVVCEDVPPVENANLRPVKESYQYRDSIKYTCLKDYTLIGEASLTCSDDGTFTPDAPECRRVQCDEPVVENGRWDGGARPPYKYQFTVTYKCNDGYKMEGEATFKCEKDNNWSPQLPTCKPIICEISPVENANVSPVKQSYGYRDSIMYTCLGDYTLIGQASLTCSDNGRFTPDAPECRRVQCDEPVVENGHWDRGARPPYKYLSTVTYKCDDGYKMDGEGTFVCEKDNNWSPRLPTCKLVTCKKPWVENANVSPVKESYQYRDSIKYTCLSGYILIGEASLTCSDEGTFKPDAPECRRVQCDEPVVKNGHWDGGAQPPYKYQSTVTYKCNDGYKMEGEGTITCEKDNNWSPRPPTCKRRDNIVVVAVLSVLGSVAVVVGFLGIFGYHKKKQSSRGGGDNNVPTKEGEDIALKGTGSDQEQGL